MIGRIRGLLVEKQPPEVLVEAAGIGYEINLPMSCFYALPECGEQVTLYTHFVVREDAQLLFGFNTKNERALFRELLKANGVGPKLGLGILSGMSAEQFIHCVHHGDASTLVKLPGVGKKTAERLVLEMKDRLKDWGPDLFTPHTDAAPIDAPNGDTLVASNAQDDAVAALEALGYKNAQAVKSVKAVAKPGMASEEMIKQALKAML
ncbi:Holliday junction branch migration protein RuvA [Pseudoalteromonas sp. MM17-2]|uniref:Holliday junction branch migration protein RuvA n=1 Tax=Pseudoalteromonas TaxID=53246 RepID=UPI001EF4122A|nr:MULTISPECIES: Holliday junction branch migration protein RuvA [Pseudoalteromonas]MCG7546114.1 Holliday junction branch migration protein RuvA [Pseudoalteromonas sp. MM17-2]MCG7565215.1 Holliday junction branch migration protein RuvA [Pseudoalteromonas sp. CnMc7-15]MCG7568478.1 Holliday junction branch migration protein RuvA [Pseudoalteromonas sp. CNC9-20]|tara:strand:- start:1510 stop:2130 length:621 start_codon:yes stop_codon:yes gene_type:complete